MPPSKVAVCGNIPEMSLALVKDGLVIWSVKAPDIASMICGATEINAQMGRISVTSFQLFTFIDQLFRTPLRRQWPDSASHTVVLRGEEAVHPSLSGYELRWTLPVNVEGVHPGDNMCAGCGGTYDPLVKIQAARSWGQAVGLYCCLFPNLVGICRSCGGRSNHRRHRNVCLACFRKLEVGSCLHCSGMVSKEEAKGGLCYPCTLNGHLVSYSANVVTELAQTEQEGQRGLESRHRARLVGVELELKSRSRDARVAIKGLIGDYALLKSDSSLGGDGFEIVSLPMSREEHYGVWQPLFEEVARSCFVDASCGLHLHLDSFSPLTLAKFARFINASDNRRLVDKVAGRGGNDFCMRSSHEQATKIGQRLRAYLIAANGHEHHASVATSARNRHRSVEVRIFASTLDFAVFMGRMEFALALADFVQNTSWKMENGPMPFQTWLSNQPYPFLKDLLELQKRKPGRGLTSIRRVEKRGLSYPVRCVERIVEGREGVFGRSRAARISPSSPHGYERLREASRLSPPSENFGVNSRGIRNVQVQAAVPPSRNLGDAHVGFDWDVLDIMEQNPTSPPERSTPPNTIWMALDVEMQRRRERS